MLYRILTENKNKAEVIILVSLRLDSFTIIEAQGYWKGSPEPSLIIEIEATVQNGWAIHQLADEIKELNKQECVLVQSIASKFELV